MFKEECFFLQYIVPVRYILKKCKNLDTEPEPTCRKTDPGDSVLELLA
jgi:hypothetical protein